jgi:hypothetical protein
MSAFQRPTASLQRRFAERHHRYAVHITDSCLHQVVQRDIRDQIDGRGRIAKLVAHSADTGRVRFSGNENDVDVASVDVFADPAASTYFGAGDVANCCARRIFDRRIAGGLIGEDAPKLQPQLWALVQCASQLQCHLRRADDDGAANVT